MKNIHPSGEVPTIKLEFRNRNIFLILLFLLSTVFLFSNLWIGDLGLDSCAYATISRSILRTNDWIVPHYEHCKEFLDCWLHPPLFYWMTAISFKIFGVNEFGARFISALLGVLTILLVYGIGHRVSRSHKIGFLSAFVLLTTQPFLDLGRKCQLDVPLAFFMTLSVLLFILALEKGTKYYILLGLSTGLALLTKGLPAISILGIVFLFFLFDKDFKFFISARFFILLLFLILTLSLWIIPLISVGEFKNFINNYFIGQIWANFVGEKANDVNLLSKIQNYFWYIIILAKRYWPWFPALLCSFYFAFKKLRAKKQIWIFLLWIFVVLLGFSLGETKFYRYLAPLYPAFALLIGIELGKRIPEKVFKIILYFSVVLLFFMLLITSLFPLYFGKINAPDKTEIKKISPTIQQLTPRKEYISVYKMNYWGAVADFAFYVDRPINNYETEKDLALSLKKGPAFGHIKREKYDNMSEEFRKNYRALVATENYLLITNIQNYEGLKERMFPLFIY